MAGDINSLNLLVIYFFWGGGGGGVVGANYSQIPNNFLHFSPTLVA